MKQGGKCFQRPWHVGPIGRRVRRLESARRAWVCLLAGLLAVVVYRANLLWRPDTATIHFVLGAAKLLAIAGLVVVTVRCRVISDELSRRLGDDIDRLLRRWRRIERQQPDAPFNESLRAFALRPVERDSRQVRQGWQVLVGDSAVTAGNLESVRVAADWLGQLSRREQLACAQVATRLLSRGCQISWTLGFETATVTTPSGIHKSFTARILQNWLSAEAEIADLMRA